MRRGVWTWVGIVGPLACLAAVVWRVGTGPIAAGISSVDVPALAVAVTAALLSTACCAWRWTVIARACGVTLPIRSAIAAYYRSQFLNVTLPGGVVGDVHRGVSHGRDVADVRGALRAVVLERFAGQVVQVCLTVILLLALPSPVQRYMPVATAVVVVTAASVLTVVRRRARRPGGREVRIGRLSRRAWFGIALASATVVAAHALTFLTAAWTAETAASAPRLLPIALLAMLAMTLPSIGGWGPREGVTAWAFAVAGLGAGHGVATGVVYGIMVFVGTLPGAIVLLVAWLRQIRPRTRQRASLRERAAHA